MDHTFVAIFIVLFISAKIMFWAAIAKDRKERRKKIKLARLKKKAEEAIKAATEAVDVLDAAKEAAGDGGDGNNGAADGVADCGDHSIDVDADVDDKCFICCLC